MNSLHKFACLARIMLAWLFKQAFGDRVDGVDARPIDLGFMMYQCTTRLCALIITAVAFGLVPASKTLAAAYPGNAVTFSAGATNTRSTLFTLTNDTLTVNGDPTEANKWYVTDSTGTKSQLVGIRSIFLVTAAGKSTGVNPVSGYIAPTSTSPLSNQIGWVTGTDTNSGIKFFDDGASGKGFPDGSHYLEVGNPASSGKSGVGTDPFGSFKFSGPLVDIHGNPLYDLGMDVMIGGGNGVTKRVWFTVPASIAPVPEAGTVVTFALLGGLSFMVLRRRKAAVKVED